VNAPVRSGSAEVSSAEAVPETCKQSDCCQLLPWVAVEIPLPLGEAQWEWRIHANFNLTLVDDTDIYIGDHTMLGPNCTLTSPIIP
jgi:hypothetical protein